TGQYELSSQKPEITTYYSQQLNDKLFYVLNYENAYIVISANKKYTPIKAFSFNSRVNTKETQQEIGMIDILKADYKNFNSFLIKTPGAITENKNKWEILLNEKLNLKSTSDQTFGPYLSSVYGQTWYYENGNPVYTTNYYTPNHNPVGCVALTFTEVMRYYEWPRKGTGSYSYSDNSGSTTGSFQANFEEDYYNWSLIPDEYKGQETSDEQRSQLGRLAFHAAVSVNMEFESNGSTSNINRIPHAASSFFRYSAEYLEKSESNFWTTLDSNMHNMLPAQLAVYTSSGAGHAIVCDGIQYIGNEKYYHLNMGWWGDDNGWYQIHESFNAGGYSNVTAAVLNMKPIPEIDDSPKFNYEDKTVALEWYYSNKIVPENFELQIKKGTDDWLTHTDTITTNEYIFQADDDYDYSIRIRAKVNNEWVENSWSNIISFGPDDFNTQGNEEFTIYPSVPTDKIKVSYKNLPGSTVRIYDLCGKLVYNNSNIITQEEFSVDISGCSKGFFILQIVNDTEKKAAKFLKL
ncbi:MAG: C10 family peptidase, partial [Bacteroidota bacterium]|nr:C10 family peptidase [Bacteroidota bacterium]